MNHVKKIIYFLLLFVFVINITANDKNTCNEKLKLLDSLYKNFPSNDLLNVQNINGQSKKTLAKYFDTTLTNLLWKDTKCSARTGMICKLDFDVIYDSQDPDRVSIHIAPTKKGADVILNYGENGKRNLTYFFSKKHGVFRICDIFYQEENRSLKKILK